MPDLNLTEEEKGVMAIFLASMLERSPRRREAMQKFFDDVKVKTEQMRAVVAHMSEKERRTFASHQIPIGEKDRENSIPASEMIKMGEDVPSLHSSGIPEMVIATAPIIYSMNWAYMEREAGTTPFLTSDSPAALVNPTIPLNSFYGPGLGQNDVELSIPLSPDITLLAGWILEDDQLYHPVNQDQVDEMNRRVARQSQTLVCNEKEILEQQVKRVKDHLDKQKSSSQAE